MSSEYGTSPFEHPPSDMAGGEGAGTCKIFVGGLSPSVTSEGLIAHFSAYGEVVDATIMNDKITGRPRGFGFVTFRQPEAVDALMQESHVLEGKQVECKRAVPMGYLDKPVSAGDRTIRPPAGGPTAAPPAALSANQRFNPEKIFVGGLPVSCDDAKLREYFSKYGVIVDAVVMIDRDLQRHRGFGYVLFQDAGAVDAAVSDHESHQIDGKWVDVKRCVVQDNTAGNWPPQSGPMRKGYGKGGMMMGMGNAYGGYMGGFQAPMAGSAGMPGYGYGMPAGRPSGSPAGYGDYGTASYYGAYKAPAAGPGTAAPAASYGARPTMQKPTTNAYGMSTGYMTSAYGSVSGTTSQPTGYGYGPSDPYASSAYGAAPSPYGAMPGYATTGYGGYGATPSAYGGYGASSAAGQSNPAGAPPTSSGAANPNDVYAASRRSGYRTSPY